MLPYDLHGSLDASVAALLDLELQDLTGLVGSPSGGCLLPPKVALRHAAPFGVGCEEGGEWRRIALVECICCGSKLVDHGASVACLASAVAAVTRPRCSRSSRPRHAVDGG